MRVLRLLQSVVSIVGVSGLVNWLRIALNRNSLRNVGWLTLRNICRFYLTLRNIWWLNVFNRLSIYFFHLNQFNFVVYNWLSNFFRGFVA